MRRIAIAAASAAAVAPLSFALTASAASAATISVDRACYVRTGPSAPPMTLAGAGFAPGGQVAITDSSGTLHATATATAAGALDARFPGPSLVLTTPGQQRDTIIATQPSATAPAIVATTATEISILGAGHGSTPSARGDKALTEPTGWVFSGWPAGKTIWVHYLVKHRQVARQAFGRASAPCGVLRVRKPLYPATPHTTSYRTQVDTVKRYSTATRPRFTLLRVGLQLEF